MNEGITICSAHYVVYNRQKETWDPVLPETLTHLMIAAQTSSIRLDEGRCTMCPGQIVPLDSVAHTDQVLFQPCPEEDEMEFGGKISNQICLFCFDRLANGKPLHVDENGQIRSHSSCQTGADQLAKATKIAERALTKNRQTGQTETISI